MKNLDFKLKIIVGLSFSLVLLFFALIWQYNELQIEKANSLRHFNNYLASHDSVVIISEENETLLAQKMAMEIYRSELSLENSRLLESLEKEKKKKAKVIIQTEIEYKDSAIYIPVTASFENNSPSFDFKYNPILKGKNHLSITGSLPYQITYDTCYVNSDPARLHYKIEPLIKPGQAHLAIEQKIDLVTGLVRDPKTKRLYVRATTDFPGISFTEMDAIHLLDDSESRQALKSARKTFGVGFSLGMGFTASSNGYIVRGPNLGVGLTYTPKFLQFGK